VLTIACKTAPTRTVTWADVPAGGMIVADGPKEDRYAVHEFETPMGRAFHVEKHGPRGGDGHVYDVLIAPEPQNDQCGCMGFLHRGSCRHRDGLRALLDCRAEEAAYRNKSHDADPMPF
jgi:hypothetical protein